MLVLDEPTSGLDAHTALQLLATLQAVASSGRAVMMSLHQPSPLLFNGLDMAMLMAEGRVVYFGPPGAAGDGMAALGCPVPPGVTVAEHLLQVVSDPGLVERVTRLQQQQQVVVGGGVNGMALIRTNSISRGGATPGGSSDSVSTHDQLTAALGGAQGALGAKAGRVVLPGAQLRRCPLGREVGVLFWRSLTDMLRNPMLTAFHAAGGLVLGLLVGVLFYQVRGGGGGGSLGGEGVGWALEGVEGHSQEDSGQHTDWPYRLQWWSGGAHPLNSTTAEWCCAVQSLLLWCTGSSC
jgi:hypothetical protein